MNGKLARELEKGDRFIIKGRIERRCLVQAVRDRPKAELLPPDLEKWGAKDSLVEVDISCEPGLRRSAFPGTLFSLTTIRLEPDQWIPVES